ncbi:hypothetical protein [Oryzifoliimicrobium ureilyticus]|uniref:hypothetical protein n=1 Tax=Oryzifoliimicrobium ureilyticus TaxID=3113724 RepID=UPI0030767594
MSAVNDFVSELFRAANEVEKTTSFEQTRLIRRAVETIWDLREQLGISENAAGYDEIMELRRLGKAIDDLPVAPGEVKEGLLKAAEMIKGLHIIQHSCVEPYFTDEELRREEQLDTRDHLFGAARMLNIIIRQANKLDMSVKAQIITMRTPHGPMPQISFSCNERDRSEKDL